MTYVSLVAALYGQTAVAALLKAGAFLYDILYSKVIYI
jgi:hypothetical protein